VINKLKIKTYRKRSCYCIIAPIAAIVKKKSSYHLKLEDALINNKKSILELQSSNSDTSLVADLRNIAVNLIHRLTSEIQREVKEKQNHRKFICRCYQYYLLLDLYLDNRTNSVNTKKAAVASFKSFPVDAVKTGKKNRTSHSLWTPNHNVLILYNSKKFSIIPLVWFICSVFVIILSRRHNEKRKYFIVAFIIMILLCFVDWSKLF
jgi:uncharacterized protein YejL (UPF0352 family)